MLYVISCGTVSSRQVNEVGTNTTAVRYGCVHSKGLHTLEASYMSICISAHCANTDVEAAITESGKQLGYSELKLKQVEVMASFLQGNNAFLSLLIFATLPLAFDMLRGQLY